MKVNNKSEYYINILFRISVCLVAIAIILPFVVPINSNLPGPDAAGAMASLFFALLLSVLLLGILMAIVAAIRFTHLRKKYRIMGFAVISLVAIGFVFLELIPAYL